MKNMYLLFLSLFIGGQIICTSCSSSDDDGHPSKPAPTEQPDEPEDDSDGEPSSMDLKADLKELATNSTLKIWTCAHRSNTLKSLKESVPGNAIQAIQYAIDAKVDMIEVDARATFDGVIVNLHDAIIDNMTTGFGALSSIPWKILSRYYLKDEKGNPTEHKIPTFEEVLKVAKDKIYICVDVKEPALLEKLIKIVDKKGMTSQVCYYIGDNTTHVKTIIRANPEAIPFPWVRTASDIDKYKTAYSKSVPMVQFDINSTGLTPLMSAIKGAKLIGYANHLLEDDSNLLNNNDFSKVDLFIQNKIEIIQTDYSDLIIPYLESKGLR